MSDPTSDRPAHISIHDYIPPPGHVVAGRLHSIAETGGAC